MSKFLEGKKTLVVVTILLAGIWLGSSILWNWALAHCTSNSCKDLLIFKIADPIYFGFRYVMPVLALFIILPKKFFDAWKYIGLGMFLLMSWSIALTPVYCGVVSCLNKSETVFYYGKLFVIISAVVILITPIVLYVQKKKAWIKG